MARGKLEVEVKKNDNLAHRCSDVWVTVGREKKQGEERDTLRTEVSPRCCRKST